MPVTRKAIFPAVLRMKVNTSADALGYVAVGPSERNGSFAVLPYVAHDLAVKVVFGGEDPAGDEVGFPPG